MVPPTPKFPTPSLCFVPKLLNHPVLSQFFSVFPLFFFSLPQPQILLPQVQICLPQPQILENTGCSLRNGTPKPVFCTEIVESPCTFAIFQCFSPFFFLTPTPDFLTPSPNLPTPTPNFRKYRVFTKKWYPKACFLYQNC